MIPGRLLSLSILLITLTLNHGDCCPTKIKSATNSVKAVKKPPKAGEQVKGSTARRVVDDNPGCKNPFLPCTDGGGAAKILTAAASGQAASKAAKLPTQQKNLMLKGLVIGGLGGAGIATVALSARKWAEGDKADKAGKADKADKADKGGENNPARTDGAARGNSQRPPSDKQTRDEEVEE